MNIVKELRKKKGIQQKELALEIGVSRPTVSEWESNKKDPSGERLKKLAEFFEVDELVVLGKGVVDIEHPVTDQVRQMILEKLGVQPQTDEAKFVSIAMDKMPPKDREKAMAVLRAMYAEYFTEDKIG